MIKAGRSYKLTWFFFWLAIIGMFLPNLGIARRTSLGMIKIEDYLFPFALVLGLLTFSSVPRPRKTILTQNFRPLFLLLLFWGGISTLTAPFRYPFESNHMILFSFVKFMKWTLYGYLGYLVATMSSIKEFERARDRTIDAIGIIVALSYLIFKDRLVQDNTFGYQASNMMSVLLSMIIAYQIGYMLDFGVKRSSEIIWRMLIIILELTGSFFTYGRAGWVALLGATIFYLRRYISSRWGTMWPLVIAASMLVSFYKIPAFRKQVDMILNPQRYGLLNLHTPYPNYRIWGLDTGGRIGLWIFEGRKFFDDPLFGRGFWHRGGDTGLLVIGSHNFFIQMFLELGVIGGIMMLFIFLRIWRFSSKEFANMHLVRNRIQLVWIVLVLGLMTGEYLYGGANIVLTFMLFSPLFSLKMKMAIADHAKGAYPGR